MKTILVPTDFSVLSRQATEYAGELAKELGAKIILLHTYMIPAPVSEVPYLMVSVDEIQKELEERIKKDTLKIFNTWGVEAEWIVRIGMPSDEIKDLTAKREIDLVIMATHGEGGLEKLIGSTTVNTIRKIHTPVLVLPRNIKYQPYRHVVYATDFTYDTNIHLFNPLLELLKHYKASLNILNVHRQHEKAVPDELIGKKNLENIFINTDHHFTTVTDVSVLHGITEYTISRVTDLAVIVSHKHSFLERVFGKNYTREMTYETKIPLLVLQDKK
jgi:nucleotide-binding universal stress UspA family protein